MVICICLLLLVPSLIDGVSKGILMLCLEVNQQSIQLSNFDQNATAKDFPTTLFYHVTDHLRLTPGAVELLLYRSRSFRPAYPKLSRIALAFWSDLGM